MELFLNDKKLKAQKPYNLKSQDVISVGDVEIIFKAHSKDFQKVSENLPSLSNETEPSPSIALPKVLLEENDEGDFSEEVTNFGKQHLIFNRFNRKKNIFI